MYRCYIIWGCNKYVVLGPVILLMATTGMRWILSNLTLVNLVFTQDSASQLSGSVPVFLWDLHLSTDLNTYTTREPFSSSLSPQMASWHSWLVIKEYHHNQSNWQIQVAPAGRIWWITRELRSSSAKSVVRKYNTAIAIVWDKSLASYDELADTRKVWNLA